MNPRLRALAAGAALLASLLPGSALAGPGDGPQTAQLEARPLVVDTDLGPDDLLALAWLADQPDIDLQAVTVSGTGLASCPAALANVRALLAALELPDTPVGCGDGKAIENGTPFPADQRAAADALYGLALPAAPDASAPAKSAQQVLAAVLDKATDPVSILALGPLTTLGLVLGDPERAVRVASVTASLGALEVAGDVVPDGSATPGAAEWNAHADPGAVQAVLDSGVPLTFVTLDAADQAAMSQTLVDGLAAGGDAPGARLAAQLVATAATGVAAGFVPHDALSAVSLSAPQVIDSRERMIAVTPDGPDAGAFVESDATGTPVQVALTADKGAFEVALLDGIRGGGATAGASPGGSLTITGGDGTCTFDPGGTSAQGDATVTGVSLDAPMIAILAGLAEGHGLDDLNSVLGTVDPAVDPPDWLLLAAYLDVAGGSSAQANAVLTPGDYAAICVTGQGSTPHYVAASNLLTIGG